MKKIVAIILLFVITLSAQDMRKNSFNSLFSDEKANKVGDAITIVVLESSQATNDARTATSRESEIGANFSGNIMSEPLPGGKMDLGTKSDFDGRGLTSSSGIFRTKIR